MSDLTNDLTTLLVRELEGFKRELDLFPNDESMWRTVPGITNSAANLAMHVAGGLQYLIGSVLGQTGYVRDREAEFNRRGGTRAEVHAELDRTIVVVREVLSRVSDSALAGDFPEPVLGLSFGTRIALLHLCAHAAFHLGQAGYLRRSLTGESRSSGPLPLAPLAN
jgi:hypothetical protein